MRKDIDMSEQEEQRGTAPALVTGGSVAAIIPTSFEQAFRLARVIAASGLAPKDLNSPEKISVAIMTGMEVGLPPMQALQSIAVINGRPTIWGDGALALVRSSGLLEWIKETVEGDGDAMIATCTVKRTDEAAPVSRTFSALDAKQAGLLGKPGPWTQYRRRMMGMRARSWALRDVFADVLRGMQVREEVHDYREMKDITPAKEEAADITRALLGASDEQGDADGPIITLDGDDLLPDDTATPDPDQPDLAIDPGARKAVEIAQALRAAETEAERVAIREENAHHIEAMSDGQRKLLHDAGAGL